MLNEMKFNETVKILSSVFATYEDSPANRHKMRSSGQLERLQRDGVCCS